MTELCTACWLSWSFVCPEKILLKCMPVLDKNHLGNFGSDFDSLSGIPLFTSISFKVGKEVSASRPCEGGVV